MTRDTVLYSIGASLALLTAPWTEARARITCENLGKVLLELKEYESLQQSDSHRYTRPAKFFYAI